MYVHGIGGGPMVAVVYDQAEEREVYACLNFNLPDEASWCKRFALSLYQEPTPNKCSIHFAEWGLTVVFHEGGRDSALRVRDAVIRALRTNLPSSDAHFRLLTDADLLFMQFRVAH